jgi:hypothetical protein
MGVKGFADLELLEDLAILVLLEVKKVYFAFALLLCGRRLTVTVSRVTK